MDVPVLVQVKKGENTIYETIGNEVDNDNLKALRKSAEIVQKNLNSYLTKLVEEERKTQPNGKYFIIIEKLVLIMKGNVFFRKIENF